MRPSPKGVLSACFIQPNMMITPTAIDGTDDTFFSQEDQTELLERLGSDTVIYRRIAGHGHNVHWEHGQAEAISGEILRFLRYVEAARR